MEKKRINKLIVPFTRKTLSILSAATILATSMGCNNKDKNKDNNSDISIPTNNSSSMEEISSEIDIIESIDSSTKETSSVESTNNTTSSSKESQTSAKPSSGSTTSNIQSSNKKPSSSQSSTSSTSSSTNSSQTPTPAPSMPTNLTADNINDVEVFKHFADKFRKECVSGIIRYDGGITDGKEEMQLIMALLNKEYVSQATMAELFGKYSLDEFKQLGTFIDALVITTLDDSAECNFNKYCIDKNLGNYLTNAQSVFIKHKQLDTEKVYEGFYLNPSNLVKQGDHFLVDYYMRKVFNIEVNLSLLNNQDLGTAYFAASSVKTEFPIRLEEVYNKFSSKNKILLK